MMTMEEFLRSRMKTGVVEECWGTFLAVTELNKTGRQILARGFIRTPTYCYLELFDTIAQRRGTLRLFGITLLSR